MVSLLFELLCSFNGVQARIFYVDDDATGANNGTSWNNAFNNLQYALYAAFYGDEIRVAQGVYTPNNGFLPDADTEIGLGARESSFRLYDNITIRGGYAGIYAQDPNARDYKLYKTILSGDLNQDDIDLDEPNSLEDDATRADNCWHIITCKSNAVLDGFFITGGKANGPELDTGYRRRGGAIYNTGSPTIMNCTFTWNYALEEGGAIYNYNSNLFLKDCTFTKNYSEIGGGLYIKTTPLTDDSNDIFQPSRTYDFIQIKIEIVNCKFIDNSANSQGGGLCSYAYSIGTILNYVDLSLDIANCQFTGNTAGSGGGIYLNGDANLLTNCLFMSNSADSGGGIYSNSDTQVIKNCLFMSNSANSGGGIYGYGSQQIMNCTSVWDSADEGAFIYNLWGGRLISCIVWYCDNPVIVPTTGRHNFSGAIHYSNIQGGWSSGTGNINVDPLFLDPLGPDNIAGTGDEDLRLSPVSPCVNTGDPSYIPDPNETDFDGNLRIVGGRVDMGAYEFQGNIYVDDDAPYANTTDDNLVEDGTRIHPFSTIQKAIDMAKDGYKILVLPGLYRKINFKGKKITVGGIEGAAVIEAVPNVLTDSLIQDAVTFHTSEGSNSVLKNFIIRNSGLAISLDYGSSPIIQNITFVDNIFGIASYENSNPDISNCIFFNNINGDLFGCKARYSCFESGTLDEGNFYADPLFVDYVNGDYHLKSQGWRWNESSESWTWDGVTSLCIDAGDPCSPLGKEPLTIPRDPNNLYGANHRINMGAYGGTCQASMPPLGWIPPNNDNTAPTPNPAQWAIGGTPKEVQKGNTSFDYWIEMEAEPASDVSGFVEYYFQCTTNSDYNSMWQSSSSYSVFVGRGGQSLRFRVKARDLYLNETEWSEEVAAY